MFWFQLVQCCENSCGEVLLLSGVQSLLPIHKRRRYKNGVAVATSILADSATNFTRVHLFFSIGFPSFFFYRNFQFHIFPISCLILLSEYVLVHL